MLLEQILGASHICVAALTLKGPATDTKPALRLTQRGLDCKTGMHPQILSEQEGEFDSDTR